jgi:hypothetical protein
MADKVTKICMDIYRKLGKSRVLNFIERSQIPNILGICYLYNLQWKYVKKYRSIQASSFLFVSSVLKHIHFEVAWYVISERCLRSANVCWTCFIKCRIFFQFHNYMYESGMAGMRSRGGQLLSFLHPPLSTHNKLPYHYGNVYISVLFL